jgi:hypothetical protein
MARRFACLVLVFWLALALDGYAFVLMPRTLPSQQRLKIVGASMDKYSVRLSFPNAKEYQFDGEGRVTIDLPSEYGGCRPMLGPIPLHRAVNPVTAKRFDVLRRGRIVRKLSLEDIMKLTTDHDGYHLLKL